MKEGSTGRRAVARTVVVGGVLISAAAIALTTPWLGLFDLREIIVSGNQRVSAETVGRAADLDRGRPLLTISRSTISARVAALPWIRAAEVRRAFPHSLSIRVEERVPLVWARTSEGETLTVGDGGIVVAVGSEDQDTLVELTGASFSASTAGARLLDERVAVLIERVHDALTMLNIQRIDVSDPSSVALDAESGLRVLLGGIDVHARGIDALVALSRAVDLGEYRQIDLRLEGEATLVTW